MKAHNSGSGRVFSGSRIWPKYSVGFEKIQNILRGKGFDCYLERGIHRNLGTGCWIFLPVCQDFRDIVHSNSWCKTTRRAYSSVYYQSKLFKQSSNQQISRQKIKTHCLNWMPGKCTWYLKSRINSYQLKGPSYIFC